jgi:transposase
MALALFAACVAGLNGPTYALTQTLVRVRMRGTSMSVLVVLLNLIGVGVGPTLAGLLSDFFAARFGADSVRWAMVVVLLTRKMAAVLKVSPSTVMRHWQASGLKPHLVRGFKISRDPKFVEKLEDIVGLYMSPPEHALVLCCDEKSRVQALDRTQPGLPLKKGRAQTMTHDYKRHGTTTLFAAMNVLDGTVIGQCQQRHTYAEWLKFLRKIDRETPKDKTLHLIADNYATHKHPVVQKWLAKHPRFNMHFTPTSASWLNMVERFFRDITTERLRRGVFTSVAELVAAINEYVAHHNTKPKPFIWTKSSRDILQKVIRANSRLSSKQNATLH